MSVDVNFFDPDLQNCPFDHYKLLRDEAPVYRDPLTGIFHVSRYEDVRHILSNHELFSGRVRSRNTEEANPRQKAVNRQFEEKGWLPAATLISRDEPNHKQMRAIFNEAFRPARVNALDSFVESTANQLMDELIAAREGDWVRVMAIPLPLTVIVYQMGAELEDLWRIKSWTDAFFRRISMMLNENAEREAIDMEIEAQHYFQPIFERLRKEPNDTVLSDLVNKVIPEWGRPLNDNELHAEMMADTFVGGSETTTNALSAGARILAEQPEIWEQLKRDPETSLKTFIEEVLRLESPVQMLLRSATRDTEIAGVAIPAGSLIGVRYGAANRDERQFDEPDRVNLDRPKPGSHLAFGSGVHHCLGAPLARRELWWGFKTLLDKAESISLAPGKNDFQHHPHCLLRSLKSLQVVVEPA